MGANPLDGGLERPTLLTRPILAAGRLLHRNKARGRTWYCARCGDGGEKERFKGRTIAGTSEGMNFT